MSATDLRRRAAERATPVVLTALCAVGVPRAVTTVVVLAGLAMTVTLVARSQRAGVLDRTLLLVGGGLLVTVLVGLAVAAAPTGLTERSSLLADAVVELVVVASTLRTDLPLRRPQGKGRAARRSAGVLPALWYVASAGLVIGGIALSVSATTRADGAPPSLALLTPGSGAPAVAVDPGRSSGPFTLTETTTDGGVIAGRTLALQAGHPVVVTLVQPAPLAGVATVTLARGSGAGAPVLAELSVRG